MEYHEGEDEKSDGRLMWYAFWLCPSCNEIIRDYDDRFEFPEKKDD